MKIIWGRHARWMNIASAISVAYDFHRVLICISYVVALSAHRSNKYEIHYDTCMNWQLPYCSYFAIFRCVHKSVIASTAHRQKIAKQVRRSQRKFIECKHTLVLPVEYIQEHFAKTDALGVVVRSECRFEAKIWIFDACAADLKRQWNENQQMLCLCNGFEAKVRICDACAADLKRHGSNSQ